ncbi:activity-dependent neuroprotector homeobox protein 2-like [Polyodon spathula]|uniref:activity-dependent neuroprotector homeobox protein 2-like n=1 Tax=Polyodon spathula TaxID=7913 RepID=UPI001B7ECAD7|nr:activity-dependent neuroprotector homeobox protein 2-like [Polyodon spathula]
MFQLPVVNLDKIRKSRKRVKEVLCDIGLQHCRELLEGVQSFDAGDQYFNNTTWWDLSESESHRRRKPRYRSNTFCCSQCKFCTKRLCAYKAHVLRCHEEDEDTETLAGCPVCPFASHPKVINQHFRIFHTMPRKNLASQSVPNSDPAPLNAVDRFSCRKCFFQDSLYYCMKKHILVSHYPTLLNSYYGQRSENEIASCRESGIPPLKFYCKICNLPADSSEALLYHILTSDKHRELEIHLKALIHENTKTGKRNQMRVPQIAPKVKVSHQVLKLSMLSGTSGRQQQQQQQQQQMKTVSLQQNKPSQVMGPPRPPANTPGAVAAVAKAQLPSPPVSLTSPIHTPLGPPAIRTVPGGAATLIRAPGSTQAFYPGGSTSALIQMATAAARSSLPSTSSVTINSLPFRRATATLPAPARVVTSLVQASSHSGSTAVGSSKQNVSLQQQQRLTVVQTAVPLNKLGLQAPGTQPLVVSSQRLNQAISAVNQPRGAMLASQSLFSQLIPTGNKVNGLPTYTLAPVQVTMPLQSGSVQNLSALPVPVQIPQGNTVSKLQTTKPIQTVPCQPNTNSKQAKQWITCPVCNELFPSNVYQVHVGIAHKQSPTNSSNVLHRLAARAPFLKKIKDKTLKCLLCKTLISEKGLFEHLLHGLNCLYCPAMFSSVKQLVEHTNSEHNTKQKVNNDVLNKEYRLYTDDHGELVFPYFDLNTAASKEQVGDKEVHLALVTLTLEVIYIKVHIEAGRPVCRITQKAQTKDCPFCPEKFESSEEYELHLKIKHHIMPTIHTILKTPAFKCIYCCGVYTGKTTAKAISVHVQRCRCAPKNTKDLERTFNPDCSIPTVVSVNGGSQRLVVVPTKQDSQMTSSSQAENPGFQSNLRLEVARRDSADASARERELIATKRKRIDSDGGALSSTQEEPLVRLELDPTGFEMRAYEARKEFLNDYFNKKPYLSKNEVEVLASRLWINKTDVACHFGSKRTRCLKTIQKTKAVVLLGFNMCELKKVKHDLNVAELNDG